MKRVLIILICLSFLCGCSSRNTALDAAHQLRNNILKANGCSFSATVTADYGDEIYEFTMLCTFDKKGSMNFTVTMPEAISGITGKIDASDGAFTFDDHVLSFKMLADGQITPVTAPWVLIKAVRGGYISACTKERNGYYLQFDDSYEEDPLTVDVGINENLAIQYGEFLWDGRRILSVKVSEFKLL